MLAKALMFAFLSASSVAVADPRAGTPADWEPPMHDPGPFAMVLADRLETGFAGEEDHYLWDAQGWYGGDRNRLWWKTEGEGEQGSSPDDAELQLLYGRMVAPFWDLQIGIRHDLRPRPDRSHVVLGLQGVAPYEFEVDAALFLSTEGDVTARVEFEYELLLTQRLILQPRLEINAAASDDRETGIASGVNTTELGVRLRYEFGRKFAPYLGVSWQQSHAGSADLARAAGAPTSLTSLVAGVRFWF